MTNLLFYFTIGLLIAIVVISSITLINKRNQSHSPSPPSPSPGPSPPSPSQSESDKWYNIFQISTNEDINYGYANNIKKYNISKYKDFYNKLTKQFATALWIDKTEHISRLSDAIKWMDNNNKTKIIIIIYNLPNRDCHATASNGHLCCVSGAEEPNWCDPELQLDFKKNPRTSCYGLENKKPNGKQTNNYKTYIDKINEIIYKNSHIEFTCIIEPDSLNNVITNSSMNSQNSAQGNCSINTAILSILPGIHYAIHTLSNNTNAKLYLEVGHPLWLGWDLGLNDPGKGILNSLLGGNQSVQSDVYDKYGTSTNAKINNLLSEPFQYDTRSWIKKLNGFTINVSNYIPLGGSDNFDTPFDSSIETNGSPMIPSSKPITPCNGYKIYNPITNLRNYAALLKYIFGNKFEKDFEVLIDTGRNGNMAKQYTVNQSNYGIEQPCASWCNIFGEYGPTIGETTFKSSGEFNIPDDQKYVKYMCLKPPGESDGCVNPSKRINTPSGQDSAGKAGNLQCNNVNSFNTSCNRFDTMCGIQGTRGYNTNSKLNFINAGDFRKNLAICPPDAGVWDPIQIQQMADNYTKEI